MVEEEEVVVMVEEAEEAVMEEKIEEDTLEEEEESEEMEEATEEEANHQAKVLAIKLKIKLDVTLVLVHPILGSHDSNLLVISA
jgi:hypothetical protein